MDHRNPEVHRVEEKRLEGTKALVCDEDRLVSHQVRQADAGHHRAADVGDGQIPRDIGLEELVLGRRLAVVDRETHGVSRLSDFAHDAEGHNTVAAVAEVALDDAGAPREGGRQVARMSLVHGVRRLGPRRDAVFADKGVKGGRIPDVGNRVDGLVRQEFQVAYILLLKMIKRPNRVEIREIPHRRVPLVDGGFHIVKGGGIGG